jgi:hypothetical protein
MCGENPGPGREFPCLPVALAIGPPLSGLLVYIPLDARLFIKGLLAVSFAMLCDFGSGGVSVG